MEIGKTLIFFGIILIIVGAIFLLGQKLPFIGRLPGDISIEKGNVKFYAPVATSIIISIILTIIINLLLRIRN